MAGWLWGRRKAGNDRGSCLPADDELQLLVGAFHQGDGLSPGAAQLHLVDVHHFITSLQLGGQGVCLPSLFDLRRREGRSERCLTWFGFHLQSWARVPVEWINLPAPNCSRIIKTWSPFSRQLTQRSVLASPMFHIDGSLESAARWVLPRSTA